jgi:4-hydroxy-2-oxoheptanedioate aldolase
VTASDLVPTLRASAAERVPSGRRGLWVSFLSAYALEAVLGARRSAPDGASDADGIDWIGLDLQHGDLDLSDVVPLLRVAEAADVVVLARMASHAGDAIGKVVDAGVHGVIVPGVESAAEATALVRATRLPPLGGRSTGTARTSLGVTDSTEPLLLPMVETKGGLEAATQIVGVEGVDGIFVGPYDLLMSLGCRPGDDRVMTAISVVETVRARGKIVGIFTGRPDLLAAASVVDLVAVDTDVSALRRGVKELLS